jgi:hypothetical protein
MFKLRLIALLLLVAPDVTALNAVCEDFVEYSGVTPQLVTVSFHWGDFGGCGSNNSWRDPTVAWTIRSTSNSVPSSFPPDAMIPRISADQTTLFFD